MKVLIVRVGAMGDVLHALPAVAALRTVRPEWVIDWVVDTRWAALLVDDAGRGPVVNRVHLAETRQWSRAPFSTATLRSVLALRRALRAERYDLVVDMQGTLRSAAIGRMAAAPQFVGYADPREAMAAWLYRRTLSRAGAHVVDQGVALLSEVSGVALTPAAVELPCVEWAEHWAETEAVLRRPLAVLSAGGGWGAKLWPAARFAELAQRLRERGYDVAVNAPRKDDALSLDVVERSGGAARLVVCNVAGLVALLRRADLVVGGDTGPLHLAAALAVPVVALFGPTDPARNGPRGPGAMRVLRDASSVTSYKHSAVPDAGLTKISVDDVVEAVAALGPANDGF